MSSARWSPKYAKVIFVVQVVVCCCLSLTSGVAKASEVTARITDVLAGEFYGSKVFLKISVAVPSPPACVSNTVYAYVFDPSTAVGKVTMSMVLSAHATGRDVYLDGMGTCNIHSGIESLRQIMLKE